MSFGSPWVLWALAAVAIPIIIHFFYFRRYKEIYFSNIQFLKEAVSEQRKTGRLKNILILLSRILAFVFLVLAFALPFLGGSDKLESASTNTLLFIDNSLSMSLIGDNRRLLDDAKNLAKEFVGNLDKEQKVMVLTNDSEGGQKAFYSPVEAIQVIDEIVLSPLSRGLEDWNKSTRQLMNDMHIEDVQAVYISDFQKNMLPEKWDSVFTQTTLLPLNQEVKTNISIDTLSLLDPVLYSGSTNQLVVKIRNQGPATTTKIQLSIQDEIVVVNEVDLPKDGYLMDTLSFLVKEGQWIRGKVSVEDAQLMFDNILYFSIDPPRTNKVLLIEEIQSTSTVYQVFKSDPHFIIKRQSAESARIDDDYSLVVLNELNHLSADFEQELINYVGEGGNLYIVPQGVNASGVYNSLLNQLGIGEFSEFKNQSIDITEINEQEPIVSIAFEKIPENIDLPKVSSYWTITSSYKVSEYPILKFENGRSFIQKYQLDNGIVFLQSSSLQSSVSNFSSKAIFAPIIYNFAIVRADIQPLYYTIGKKQIIKGIDIASTNKDVIKMRSGQLEAIPAIYPMGQKIGVEIPNSLTRDGIYELVRNENKIAAIATNFDRRESEMQFATPTELKEMYPDSYIYIETPHSLLQKNSNGILKSNVRLWKVCVILALIFLTIEIVLIRLFSNKPAHEI